MEGSALFIFTEGLIHDFDLEVAAADWEALDQRREDDVHATLGYAGTEWDVGVHLKGESSYQGLDAKPAFKIDMSEWVPGQRFYGVRHITLNNMVWDESMLTEHVAYALYARMGVPAPRHGYARVWLNGEPLGLYGIVETMDQDFIDRHWPTDWQGNLYDSRFNWGDISALGIHNFDVQEEGTTPPFEDLQALLDRVDHGGDFADVLDARFDADDTLTMWAIELVLSHWDGYPQNSNNYLLYHQPLVDRWVMLPWGEDQAMSGNGPVHAGWKGRLLLECASSSQCLKRLDAKMLEVAEHIEQDEMLDYARATWDLIRPACLADPRKRHDCDAEGVFQFLAQRPTTVRSLLR